MRRYLMYISYLGTRFRGIQRQISKAQALEFDDPVSVQGMLEIALKKLRPAKAPEVIISSRTDAGVHALRTAVHVDLERETGKNYQPYELVTGINRFFDRSDIGIRVQECQIVPETFHARYNAIKRSYLYRLAVRKPDAPELFSARKDLTAQYPIWDWRRCYYIQNPEFDIEKFKSAANLFPGEKDFRTFMGSVKGDKKHGVNDTDRKEISTIRDLQFINISIGQPCVSADIESISSHYNYWNIVLCSKSFLYRQVRRMIGVLVAVAQGKLQQSDVERMLAEPSPNSWNTCVVPAPAFGLYMLNVEYNPSDLIIDDVNACAHTESRVVLEEKCKVHYKSDSLVH